MGRPPKAAGVEREATREPIQHKMRAKPNWETMNPDDDETPDRLRIPKELFPDGMDFQWVTDSIFGQPQPQRRSTFEKAGWTPVHNGDFDGLLDGRFTPAGTDGELKVDGVVLMARPLEYSKKAKIRDRRQALEQVAIKEQSLKGGDIGTSLDSQHPSAVRSNRISKTVERLNIPED